MRDLLFVALTVGFFGLAAAFVRGCARIVGPDPACIPGDAATEPQLPPAEVGS